MIANHACAAERPGLPTLVHAELAPRCVRAHPRAHDGAHALRAPELRERMLRSARDPSLPMPGGRAGFLELLAGRWVLVDRFEAAGMRYLVACAQQGRPEHAPLPERARTALELATRGVANKVIALELQVSQATVTRLLVRALAMLRLADMGEAMALARTAPSRKLAGEPDAFAWTFPLSAPCDFEDLTAAERDIVQRVVARASRAQIARARGTSLYTVNSQLATIFAKLGVRSKRELLQQAVVHAAERGHPAA